MSLGDFEGARMLKEKNFRKSGGSTGKLSFWKNCLKVHKKFCAADLNVLIPKL